MNAQTQSTTSAIKARNPQFRTSRAPRIAAAALAVAITLMLFDGVALLGSQDDGQMLAASKTPVVAQATTNVQR